MPGFHLTSKTFYRACLFITAGLLLIFFYFNGLSGVPSVGSGLKPVAKPRVFEASSYAHFCGVPSVIAADQPTDPQRITLVLHASFDRISLRLADQIENWDGPVSLAVVFPTNTSLDDPSIACTFRVLRALRRRRPAVAKSLDVHFLIPKSTNSSCQSLKIDRTYPGDHKEMFSSSSCGQKACGTPLRGLYTIGAYPVNYARNYARNNSRTMYIVIADLDHFFSEGFEKRMLDLAQSMLQGEKAKTALVYRIFEIANHVQLMPKDKSELMALYDTGDAAEFHHHYGAHAIPGLKEWFAHSDDPQGNLSVQLFQPYKKHEWEPQFVSLNTIPYHDVSFSYPLRDNTVLRWEMCCVGYSFAVVNDVFMYHPGMPSGDKNQLMHLVRFLIRPRAQKAFSSFALRMNLTHPETQGRCVPRKLV